jgi:hypothetical protein
LQAEPDEACSFKELDMNFKLIKWPIAIALGALAGYAYWYYIGCNSGSCAITSSPLNSSIYGAVMGGLFLNMFTKDTKK